MKILTVLVFCCIGWMTSARAAEAPAFFATASGGSNNLTLAVTAETAEADVRKVGELYVVVVRRDGSFIANNGTRWVPWDGSSVLPAYYAGTLTDTTVIPLVAGANVSDEAGAQVWIGYGIGGQADMLDHRKYKMVYTIPRQPDLEAAGAIEITASAAIVTFRLNERGKYIGLADEQGSFEVDPKQTTVVCFNSNRVGWGLQSHACAPIREHVAIVPLCSNDQGTLSVRLADNRVLWFDLTSQSAGAWIRTGLASNLEKGWIEYGRRGYRPARVSSQSEGTSDGVPLSIDFGSNCLGGFSQPLDSRTPLLFVWNSDQAGWGINSAQPSPSAKWAFLEWNEPDEAYRVVFNRLACGDKGSITVYKPKKTVPIKGEPVDWDTGMDGFGFAWVSIPANETNPQWNKDAGVSFIHEGANGHYIQLPSCD